MNQVELIRAEIERRRNNARNWSDNAKYKGPHYHKMRGVESACDALLSFLDTMEESERPEPYNPVYDEAYLNEKIAKASKSWEGVDVDAMLDECRGREKSEKPNYLNELADYARRQVEELLSVIKKYDDYSEEQIEGLRTHLMAMFLEGAGWQKEQMMRNAVPFYEILKVVPPGPERDIVKLIIIKE